MCFELEYGIKDPTQNRLARTSIIPENKDAASEQARTWRRVVTRRVFYDHVGRQPRGEVDVLPLYWQIALAQRVQSRKLPPEDCTFSVSILGLACHVKAQLSALLPAFLAASCS